jgi:hypothetical protein
MGTPPMSSRKKLLSWIVGGVAAAATVVCGALYYLVLVADIDLERLSPPRRWVGACIAEKWVVKMETIPEHERNTIAIGELEDELSWYELEFARKVLGIEPGLLGFAGPYHGAERPLDLVRVDRDGEQLFPRDALKDFERIRDQMQADIGKVITMKSGYRSPGKQAYLFFYSLADAETGSGFSLAETARRIALPGYSEHASSTTPALDFSVAGEDELLAAKGGAAPSYARRAAFIEATAEYEWLRKNAHRFNFYLSYPRDNELGVDFEPWHWRWERPGSADAP